MPGVKKPGTEEAHEVGLFGFLYLLLFLIHFIMEHQASPKPVLAMPTPTPGSFPILKSISYFVTGVSEVQL